MPTVDQAPAPAEPVRDRNPLRPAAHWLYQMITPSRPRDIVVVAAYLAIGLCLRIYVSWPATWPAARITAITAGECYAIAVWGALLLAYLAYYTPRAARAVLARLRSVA